MLKANFCIVKETPDMILIRDLNGEVSITNDVEEVVKVLWVSNHIDGIKSLYYIDSTERIDKIIYDESNFIDFKILNLTISNFIF